MSIYKSLSKFHEEVGRIAKDSTNPHYRSKYADIDTVLDAIREPLRKAGLCFTQIPIENGLKTIISTVDGEHFIEGFCPFTLSKNDMQGLGSAMTYARRYSLVAMLGLEVEDDDGNRAVQPKPQPKPNPALTLFNKLKEHYKCEGEYVVQMLKFLNITSADTEKVNQALNNFSGVISYLDEHLRPDVSDDPNYFEVKG